MRIATAEPRTASTGLQFTGFTPIQPLPTIKEVMADTRQITQQVQRSVVEAQNVEPQQVVAPDPVVPVAETAAPPAEPAPVVETPEPPAEADVADTEPAVATDETVAEPSQPAANESFEECWVGMVDAIFQKKPAFYHQLRDYLPRYEDDVIYVEVENDFQKNQLEMSKRAMLEFWRAHYQLNVNEMEFVIHEHERKKVIYTSEDKVNNMLEQNPELKDFLQVLNFRIKD